MTALAVGLLLVVLVLWEAFETLVLPRRVSRRLRFTRGYYRVLWGTWTRIGPRRPGQWRELYLSIFAPLSMLMLLGFWVIGVVVGFALMQWGLDTPLAPVGSAAFGTHLYLSATSFVTLGLGDYAPTSGSGHAIVAIEAAAGFAFLALTISYLPVLYQAFSRREVRISMLDQWAGSPPSAVELLRRAASYDALDSVSELLATWERWAAELLESHLSYPVLAYFRSQHEHESWLAALTSILDLSSLVLAGVNGVSTWQARRTFAISRHAVVDLAQVLHMPPHAMPQSRLDAAGAARARRILEEAGIGVHPDLESRLGPLRAKYEPYVYVLSGRVEMELPGLLPDPDAVDDWERTAWNEPE
ncbi:MAG TPA: ion channel [Actinomycetota bacterium]|nr:ion channel [Actinomycetota bacterium]